MIIYSSGLLIFFLNPRLNTIARQCANVNVSIHRVVNIFSLFGMDAIASAGHPEENPDYSIVNEVVELISQRMCKMFPGEMSTSCIQEEMDLFFKTGNCEPIVEPTVCINPTFIPSTKRWEMDFMVLFIYFFFCFLFLIIIMVFYHRPVQ